MDEVLSGSQKLIAGAIVVAGACIGAGLYFGLSAQTPAPQPPPNSTVLRPQTQDPSLKERVDAEITRKVAELRPTLSERCWKPSAEREPEPASATFRVRLVFDATGTLAHSGVGDAEDERRADVAKCLREADFGGISIEPPGDLVGTELSLTLP